MNVNVDLTNVQAEGSVIAGTFGALIVGAELKETKRKDGIYLRVDVECDNEVKISDFINVINPKDLTEKLGRQRLKALLAICGLPLDNFQTGSSLIGKRVSVVVVKHEADDGVDYPKIKKFLPENAPKGLERAPAPASDIPNF